MAGKTDVQPSPANKNVSGRGKKLDKAPIAKGKNSGNTAYLADSKYISKR